MWTLAGGNLELVRFCIEHRFDVLPALPVAIEYHQYAVTSWAVRLFMHSLAQEGLESLEDDAITLAEPAVLSDNIAFLTKYQAPYELALQLLPLSAKFGRLQTFRLLAEIAEPIEPPVVVAAVMGGSISILRRAVAEVYGNALGDAIFTAASIGRIDMLDMLVKAGAPISPTVLLRACDRGHVRVAIALLAAGASQDPTALEVAITHGHAPVVNALLAQRFPPPENAVEQALRGGHLDVLQLLINAGVTVHEDALRVAAQVGLAGALAIVQRCPSVDINARDDHQLSALQWAVKKKDPETGKLRKATSHASTPSSSAPALR
jgi:hypothetical protein